MKTQTCETPQTTGTTRSRWWLVRCPSGRPSNAAVRRPAVTLAIGPRREVPHRAPHDPGGRLDHHDSVERDDVGEVMGAHDGVVAAHGGAAGMAHRDRSGWVAGGGAVEAGDVLRSFVARVPSGL